MDEIIRLFSNSCNAFLFNLTRYFFRQLAHIQSIFFIENTIWRGGSSICFGLYVVLVICMTFLTVGIVASKNDFTNPLQHEEGR